MRANLSQASMSGEEGGGYKDVLFAVPERDMEGKFSF